MLEIALGLAAGVVGGGVGILTYIVLGILFDHTLNKRR